MSNQPEKTSSSMNLSGSLEQFLQSLSDGFILTNAAWDLLFANARACSLLNIKDQGLKISKHLQDNFIVATDFDSLDLAKGEIQIQAHRQESDHFQALYLVLQSFQADSWLPEGTYALLVKDQTEKHLEDVIKADFLTLISHKMRTPVVALSYAMSLIQRRDELEFSREEVDDFLEQASFKSFEISDLIEKLIRYCSVVKDQFHERFETFNLQKMVEEAIEKYERKFKKIRPPFNIEVADIPSNIMIALPHEYGILLFENLIDNALKFNIGDTVTAKISVSSVKGSEITCIIEDNGPGIPSEFLDSIFDPYHQIEKHFSGAVEGVGLGLTLAKHILDVYHQSIQVDSLIGKGTKVSFTLPVQKA